MEAAIDPAASVAGSAKGFESLEDEVRVDSLPLSGELPEWLTGSLLRTGPAKWEVGERTMNHWFDGFAMLHRFGIGGGRVSYASRFLEGNAYRDAKRTGRITLLRVRDRPVPVALPAGRRDVLARACPTTRTSTWSSSASGSSR